MLIRYATATRDARLEDALEAELLRDVGDALDARFGAERVGLVFGDRSHAARVRAIVDDQTHALLRRHAGRGLAWPDHPDLIVRRVGDALTGLGPIQPLLEDPLNEGIEVNGTHVWVVRDGRGLRVNQSLFASEDAVAALAREVVGRLGARVDEASPIVNVRLPDGSRMSVFLPPVCPFPAIVIRMHRLKRPTLAMLEGRGVYPPEVTAFLRAVFRARLNLVISGRTGSGKTTLLDAGLAEHASLDDTIRLVTVEEVGELDVTSVLPRSIPFYGRPPNIEGKGEITVRYLVREALRGDPDILIVGEARGAEAYDLLQAMNTGHDGSSTTLHANSPRHAVDRFATMAGQSPEKVDQADLRATIAASVDLIIQLGRPPGADGRRVTEIFELESARGGEVHGHPLWAWRDGALRLTGTTPTCLERLAEAGEPYHWPPVTGR